MKSVDKKRKKEQRTVTTMIHIYCRGNHKDWWKKQRGQTSIKSEQGGQTPFMCPECLDLSNYVVMRSQKCPYLAKGTKTFCNQCKTPCYKPEYREKIRKVMRYSGPKILFFMPGICLHHFVLTMKKNFKPKVSFR